jgi:DNA-binding MarR family transcriptional regulator
MAGSSTDSAPDWLDESEERVWNAFFEMQVLFWRRLARELHRDTGLSEPDLAILAALLDAPDGRLRPYELSGVTQFEKSRLHHHLTRMTGRGLIVRERCPGAARGAVIVLTAQGREAITRALPRRAAHIREHLLDPLDAEQREQLTVIAHRMLTRLRPGDSGCAPS